MVSPVETKTSLLEASDWMPIVKTVSNLNSYILRRNILSDSIDAEELADEEEDWKTYSYGSYYNSAQDSMEAVASSTNDKKRRSHQ